MDDYVECDEVVVDDVVCIFVVECYGDCSWDFECIGNGYDVEGCIGFFECRGCIVEQCVGKVIVKVSFDNEEVRCQVFGYGMV